MNNKGGTSIDDSEDEIVESLKSLGMSRNLATTIAYLADSRQASSQEIEMNTGLRQPEVSVAMRSLRENSWVNVRNEKVTGKGRPTKIYTLATPLNNIVEHYEKRIIEENKARMSIIEKLKKLSE